MIRIALSTLRHRSGAFAAGLITAFLGATILMSFASLLDTAAGPGVSNVDQRTLTIMAEVIGGWGLLIVAFGIASTMSLTVAQRGPEIALLKSAGATPAQVGRMIVGETAIVSAVASALAVPVAFGTGRAVLAALASTGQVTSGLGYRFGPLALGVGLGTTFAAAAIAAFVTARRAARAGTRDALASSAEEPRPSRKRLVFGLVFLFIGADCGVLTATVLKKQGYVTMSIAGEACIWTAIGFALLAPVLLRVVNVVLGMPLRGVAGTAGYLGERNVRQRAARVSGIAMPVVLFTGLAAGSLYLSRVQSAANRAAHVAVSADERGVDTLNVVIVSMIAIFAAVVLVNVAIATTIDRRREFGRQRLIGSTPGQVLGMVAVETAVTAGTGVLFGTVAALAGIVPYAIALGRGPVPDAGLSIYLGVVGTAVALTFASSLLAGRHAIRRPAIEAAAA